MTRTDRSDRSGRTAVLEWALVLPAVLSLALAFLGSIGASVGFVAAVPGDLTISEAAALRDRAELIRLIRAGVDVAARARVRSGIIRDREYMLTPLEAATATQRDEIVRLLVSEGAPLDESSFPTVYCIAASSGFETIVELLRKVAPDREPPQCENVQLPL
jgi:hypothetical protein